MLPEVKRLSRLIFSHATQIFILFMCSRLESNYPLQAWTTEKEMRVETVFNIAYALCFTCLFDDRWGVIRGLLPVFSQPKKLYYHYNKTFYNSVKESREGDIFDAYCLKRWFFYIIIYSLFIIYLFIFKLDMSGMLCTIRWWSLFFQNKRKYKINK